MAASTHSHVGVEVGAGVVVPVVGHRRPQGGVGLVVPEAAQQPVGLAEAEEVLGERHLVDAGRPGALAVVGHLLERGSGVALAMGPQVQVVVEHRTERSRRLERAHPPPEATGHGPDERDAVSHRRLHAHHAGVGHHGVVEGADGAGVVGLVGVVDHPPAPQGVVGGDEAPRGELGEDRFVVGEVVGLVGVDEHEVEGPVELRHGVEGGALDDLDRVRVRAAGDVGPGHRGVHGAQLAGGDASARGEPGRHRQRGVAAEGPDLEHPRGAQGVDEHLEEAALERAHHHLRGRQRGPGLLGQRHQMVGRARWCAPRA